MTGMLLFVISFLITILALVKIFSSAGLKAYVRTLKGDSCWKVFEGLLCPSVLSVSLLLPLLFFDCQILEIHLSYDFCQFCYVLLVLILFQNIYCLYSYALKLTLSWSRLSLA